MTTINLASTLVALGAGDHEMNTIEVFLRAIGAKFVHVVNEKGERVAPSQAYSGASIRLAPSVDPSGFKTIVLIECRPALDLFPDAKVVVVDHHNPGDPGYGAGPEDFFRASSIGQLLRLLTEADVIGTLAHNHRAMETPHDIEVERPGGYVRAYAPTQDQILCAAGDHSPEAAYRGKCPGVDPDALMKWRLARTVEFRNSVRKPGEPEIKPEDILRAVEAARVELRVALTPQGFADLRHKFVPELPEAALREGIPFLSKTIDRATGKNKVGLMAAPPDLVRRFMAGEIVPGLTGVYGDPARGFAGGYE